MITFVRVVVRFPDASRVYRATRRHRPRTGTSYTLCPYPSLPPRKLGLFELSAILPCALPFEVEDRAPDPSQCLLPANGAIDVGPWGVVLRVVWAWFTGDCGRVARNHIENTLASRVSHFY